jgi:hypothetical protein
VITLAGEPQGRQVKWIGIVGYRLEGLADGLLRRAFGLHDPLKLSCEVRKAKPVQLFGERPAHVCGSSQVGPEIVHVTSEVM